ncbi:MAG: discoidin domain-containing protein [Anaerolineae bacterium]
MFKMKWLLLCIVVINFSLTGIIIAQDTNNTVDALLKNVVVRPIGDIVDAELIVTNFANDGTATLPITTSVPVACSIVYGTTSDFGSLSVDQDMNGGTHSVHNPLLKNLEPETKYYFRVQGTDDAGIIYLSDVMTFITPAQQPATTTNLASPEMGAEITGYSSAFGNAGLTATWGAQSAVDGSPNTAWSSAGDGDKAWLEIKLAQRSQIDRIEYWSRSMSDGTSRVLEFTITADDGTVYGPFSLPDASQAYSFNVDFQTTTLRFAVVKSSGGNTGAVEFGVYGTPIAAASS